ncbi:MAG: phosphatase PAP2 family protein [Solirubrobacterales bacterium]
MRAIQVIKSRVDGWLPNGILDAGLQFALFFLAYQGYQVVRGITDSGAIDAYYHAYRVMDLERSVGLFFEPGFQQALLDHASWLVDFANFMYLNSHFVVTTGFLAWLYLRRNDHFYFVRNMFLVAMGLALIGYALYPTAPPRLFPGQGFTDTIAAFTGVTQDSKTASLLLNQYAAVPSMHIAFSLMVGLTAASLVRHPLLRMLWFAYPLLVFFVIVATGNHYWIDAAAGALVAGLATVAALQLARLRPRAWAWPAAA